VYGAAFPEGTPIEGVVGVGGCLGDEDAVGGGVDFFDEVVAAVVGHDLGAGNQINMELLLEGVELLDRNVYQR